MRMTLFLASFFSLAAFTAFAADFAEPTYEECFKLAEKAIAADVVGLHMEAETVAAKGLATPATLPPEASDSVTVQNTLPGLDGHQDFEAALRQQGVRIIVDPANPNAAPTVELDNVRLENGQTAQFGAPEGAAETAAEAENEENEKSEPSAADLYELNRTHCRIMYGIHF